LLIRHDIRIDYAYQRDSIVGTDVCMNMHSACCQRLVIR